MYRIRLFFRKLFRRKPRPLTDEERTDKFLGG